MTQTTADDVRRHIEYKALARELDRTIADRMLAALDDGDEPNYAALLDAATFIPPPTICYHTAKVSDRNAIRTNGLRAGLPSNGPHWGDKASGQPHGVYVAPEPDMHGKWAQEATWDVWAVTITDLPWAHDRLNPGCFVIMSDVPPDRLTHVA